MGGKTRLRSRELGKIYGGQTIFLHIHSSSELKLPLTVSPAVGLVSPDVSAKNDCGFALLPYKP